MKKYTFKNVVVVATMFGLFALGVLGLHLQIGEANALFWLSGFVLIWVWGDMSDEDRYSEAYLHYLQRKADYKGFGKPYPFTFKQFLKHYTF